jgi:hypothetical protein
MAALRSVGCARYLGRMTDEPKSQPSEVPAESISEQFSEKRTHVNMLVSVESEGSLPGPIDIPAAESVAAEPPPAASASGSDDS